MGSVSSSLVQFWSSEPKRSLLSADMISLKGLPADMASEAAQPESPIRAVRQTASATIFILIFLPSIADTPDVFYK